MGKNTDMVRAPYRALINAGRTYAAFDKETTLPLINSLKNNKIIIDPMAGFGSLMNFCSVQGISTINIEYNPPTYLWGVLNNPKNASTIINLIDRILTIQNKFPAIKKKGDISDEWFTPLAENIICDLFRLIRDNARKHVNRLISDELSLALLIPFSGRLSCYVQGNIVTNVKKGGICLYSGVEDDFDSYLKIIRGKLDIINKTSLNIEHEYIFGNSINIKMDNNYSAFITSPPYPNGRDYFKMFSPENACISFLQLRGLVNNLVVEDQLIGSVSVSKQIKKVDYNREIISDSARKFINYIAEFEDKKRQKSKYDNAIYYVPYFSNYFFDIQEAYRNILTFLNDHFEGYIVVTNNTARNVVIPVAQSIVETFHKSNIEAKIVDKYTRELSHVGTMNPRVKGFKARHMEYTIKVWRH